VYEWVNVRQYCKALWIKTRYNCNPFTIYTHTQTHTHTHTHTHSGGGGRVYVDDTLDVGPHGVDGGVRREAEHVHAEVGGASLHHLAHDVDLQLRVGGAGPQRERR